jgi:hypothetical protein
MDLPNQKDSRISYDDSRLLVDNGGPEPMGKAPNGIGSQYGKAGNRGTRMGGNLGKGDSRREGSGLGGSNIGDYAGIGGSRRGNSSIAGSNMGGYAGMGGSQMGGNAGYGGVAGLIGNAGMGGSQMGGDQGS